VQRKILFKKAIAITFVFNLIFCGTSFAGFYRYNVDELARKARKKIKEIERKIAEQEISEVLKEVLAKVQDLFEKGEGLYNQGKYKEAADFFLKIDKLSRDKEVKKWLDKASKF
jgi:23S rRNA A2030 N6-methylase RlmJ